MKEEKYCYKPSSTLFSLLFQEEHARIVGHVGNLSIEHVGSTAVPGLGGKGIIDMAIAVDKGKLEEISLQLQGLGYQFKPSFSTADRHFLTLTMADSEKKQRVYHLHLVCCSSKEWHELVGFRDYLRSHPEEVDAYNALKREAAYLANQEGHLYRAHKKPFIERILFKLTKG